MKRTFFYFSAAAILILPAGGFQKDLRAKEKTEKKDLITSGVKLKPILIGSPAADKKRSLADEGAKYDGALNIVIDTPYQIWGEMGTYIHIAVFDPKFNPAGGAAVYMDGQAFGQTDKTGTFVFSQAPNPDDSYGHAHMLDIVYKKGGKKYRGNVNFNAYPRTQGFEAQSVFVYTDRGVYNPGQTVHIRSIAWGLKDDFSPLASKNLEFLLKDSQGRVVAGGGVETDKWGIASMDIPLPENAPEGNYKLEANVERESASADLRIERFTPPVIEIRHTLGRFLTRDTDELPFEVNLSYFGGGTFKAGKVHLSVKAANKIAYEEKKSVKGAGPHKFVFDKAALEKIRKGVVENETVQVKIAVTDDFGRKDEVKRDMRYTSNPYVVVVETDKDQYTTGEKAHIMIRATDLDKVPIREKEVRMVIDGKTHKEKTDASGVAKFDIEVPEKSLSGEVFLEGVDNPVAYAYVNWVAPRPMSSEIPQGYVKEKELTTIQINFPTDFVPKEDVVHVDIVDSSGALIDAALIPISMKGGKYAGKGKFPAPTWGSMLLTIFCVGSRGKDPVGLLTDGQNLPVMPDREIKIDLKGAPAKAAPGETIKVTAMVKNAKGKKIDAAVGASIVDEAVLSMLDPLEKTPMDKFYNPQFKVLSTTGSKILTWPVVTRNWGYPMYDIALPPFGFRSGGANSQEHMFGAKGTPPEPVKPPKDKTGKKTKKDKDGDGIMDKDDKCPKEPEVYNGLEDEDGCPDMGKVMVQSPAPDYYDMPEEAMEEESGMGMPAPAPPMKSAKMSKKKGKGGYDYSDDLVSGELMKEDAEHKLSRGAEKTGAKPGVSITVRTNFAETSLWAPDLEAEKGKLELTARLPDSITTQTVTLLASDDKGGVGMLRKKIDVLQDVYVRSNLPATLTMGDSVEVYAMVKNLTKKKLSAEVSFASDGIDVVGDDTKKVSVPAEGIGVAGFTVKPKNAGMTSYEVRMKGGGYADAEKRAIFIRPLGVPDLIRAGGTLSKKKKFKANVKLSGSDMYVHAFMNVSFPTAVPAIQGMEEILSQPGGAIDFVSSKALITAMVYQYLSEHGKNEEALERIGPFLQQLMAALLMTQNPDGGWGWHFLLRKVSVDGKTDVIPITSNPYMTAQSLEALVEMKRARLPVPEQAVGRAMQSLAASMDPGNLWSVDDIAFWEGKTPEVQAGVSAEIFRVMADACDAYPALVHSWNMKKPMDKLFKAFETYLDMDEMRDPMALASAAMGAFRWAKVSGQLDKNLEKKLKAAAKKLIVLRKEAYWEPSWFNAFGGTLEATTAAMMFMHAYDKEAYDAELRRSIQYILSTQESFGAWHNARGTAAAIRALLLMPPTAEEVPSTVRVLINGKVIEKVDIDPDDPYLTAIRLRQVEITKHLKKGDNMVELIYDGNLKAPVTLQLQKWTHKKAYSALRQKGAPDAAASRTYKGEPTLQGAPVEVHVKVKVKDAGSGPLMIREPLPSNAQVEGASLDKLMDDKKVAGYELDAGAIVFYVVPEKAGSVKFSYRLEGTRRGMSIHPGTLVSSVADPDAWVTGKPTKFNVK